MPNLLFVLRNFWIIRSRVKFTWLKNCIKTGNWVRNCIRWSRDWKSKEMMILVKSNLKFILRREWSSLLIKLLCRTFTSRLIQSKQYLSWIFKIDKNLIKFLSWLKIEKSRIRWRWFNFYWRRGGSWMTENWLIFWLKNDYFNIIKLRKY